MPSFCALSRPCMRKSRNLAHVQLENPYQQLHSLHLSQNSLLELSLDLLSGLISVGLAVKVEKSTEVELWCLQQLDLSNVNVLEWVDALGGLLDLTTNDLWDELGCELCKGAGGSLADDDLGHLLADGTDLGRSGVGGLLDLVWTALGETNGEDTEEVVIGGLDGDVGLDQGLPLTDQRSKLVGCEVETVEVGQAVLALDLIDSELNLAESVVLILLEISERDLDDSALQSVVGILETGGTVDKGLSDISDSEGGWCLDGVPILAGEGILGSLLDTLLTL